MTSGCVGNTPVGVSFLYDQVYLQRICGEICETSSAVVFLRSMFGWCSWPRNGELQYNSTWQTRPWLLWVQCHFYNMATTKSIQKSCHQRIPFIPIHSQPVHEVAYFLSPLPICSHLMVGAALRDRSTIVWEDVTMINQPFRCPMLMPKMEHQMSIEIMLDTTDTLILRYIEYTAQNIYFHLHLEQRTLNLTIFFEKGWQLQESWLPQIVGCPVSSQKLRGFYFISPDIAKCLLQRAGFSILKVSKPQKGGPWGFQ